MVELGVRLHTDEMINPDLARQQRTHGYDVVSCEDAGRSNRALSDEDQLAYAAAQGRAILTYNAQDDIRLDHAWKAAGRSHGGIVLVSRRLSQDALGPFVTRHMDAVAPSVQDDTLLWLDTSPIP